MSFAYVSFSHLYLSLASVVGVAQTVITLVFVCEAAGLTIGSMAINGTVMMLRNLSAKVVETVLQAITIIEQSCSTRLFNIGVTSSSNCSGDLVP